MALDQRQNTFTLNILIIKGRNLTNLVFAFIIDEIKFGIDIQVVRKFAAEFWPLIEVEWNLYILSLFRARGAIIRC